MERVQAVYVLNNINLNTIFVWGNQNQNRLCPVQPLCNAMQLTAVVFKDRASYGFQCPPKEEHSAMSPWGIAVAPTHPWRPQWTKESVPQGSSAFQRQHEITSLPLGPSASYKLWVIKFCRQTFLNTSS